MENPLYQRLTTILDPKKKFKIIFDTSIISNNQEGTTNEIPDDLSANNLTSFKYFTITTVDVERKFSVYKN